VANPQEAGPPTETANVTPIDPGTAQTRQIVDAVKATVAGLQDDVKDIRNYRYTDLLLHIGAFAGGIVLVVGMIITVYLRLDDKILGLSEKMQGLSTSQTRIDAKLEDLLQRIPPVQSPAPRRNP
jgi:hypothetical protein